MCQSRKKITSKIYPVIDGWLFLEWDDNDNLSKSIRDKKMKSVIVWDIETVPDLEGFARVHKLNTMTDEEIRAAMGAKFTSS